MHRPSVPVQRHESKRPCLSHDRHVGFSRPSPSSARPSSRSEAYRASLASRAPGTREGYVLIEEVPEIGRDLVIGTLDRLIGLSAEMLDVRRRVPPKPHRDGRHSGLMVRAQGVPRPGAMGIQKLTTSVFPHARKRSEPPQAFLACRTEEPLIVRMESTTSPAAATFEEFFLDTNRDLTGALWLVTRNTHEAEEIAQDAYLKLWERWSAVGSMDDPTAYLHRTAWNLWRSRGRRAAVALRRVVHAIPADEATAGVESRDVVIRALASLTPRQRAAIVLVDLLDMTSPEAAEALGVRPSTVRVLTSRARASLKEGMES